MTQPVVTLKVNLGSEVVAALRQMAACKDVSLTETLCRAISNELFFTREQAAGRRILLARPDGQLFALRGL